VSDLKNNVAVIETAKKLLAANGISATDLQSKTSGNETAIRSMALRLLAKKTKPNSNN
jgi:hypothetical protein